LRIGQESTLEVGHHKVLPSGELCWVWTNIKW